MKSFIAILFFLGLIAVSLADPYNKNNYRRHDQYSHGQVYQRNYDGYNNRPMHYNNRDYSNSYQNRPYSSHSGPYNSYRAPSYPKA